MSDRIYPDWPSIEKLKPQPTKGEYALLKHLDKELPPSFEIFFQPSLNGDKPDIAILEKDFGLMIIEVKDWDLNSYITKEDSFTKTIFGFEEKIRYKKFYVLNKNKQIPIKGPLSQVNRYIENLIDLYEPELKERISGSVRQKMFRKSIYFHNATTEEALNFLFFEDKDSRKEGMEKCLVVGFDQLDNFSNKIQILLKENLDNIPIIDDNKDSFDWVSKIRFWLKPPFHELESGEPITLTKSQKSVLDTTNKHIRIKGVAGSGKTLVLAQKAASLAQDGKKVLVISFNITLWHYIRDCISRARYGFSWDRIEFGHFHGFCKNFLEENNIRIPYELDDEHFDDFMPQMVIDCLNSNQNIKNRRYDAIIVDEGQDYTHEWYDMLCKFLTNNNEFVFAMDDKQNIYERSDAWIHNMTGTEFRGPWRELKECMRMPEKILYETTRFEKLFLQKSDQSLHATFISENLNQLNFLDPHLIWRNVIDVSDKKNKLSYGLIDKICIAYKWLTETKGEHPQDIVFLLPDHNEGLDLAKEFKKRFKLKINHVFQKKYKGKRRANYKKKSFWMKSPRLKMCTIHSFKGWELKNVVLITPKDIDIPSGNREKFHRMMYTSLTRTRGNIIVFNRISEYEDYGNQWPDKW